MALQITKNWGVDLPNVKVLIGLRLGLFNQKPVAAESGNGFFYALNFLI